MTSEEKSVALIGLTIIGVHLFALGIWLFLYFSDALSSKPMWPDGIVDSVFVTFCLWRCERLVRGVKENQQETVE